MHADVLEQCDALFRRARDTGVLRPDTDPEWARRVYYALIHEADQERSLLDDGQGGSGRGARGTGAAGDADSQGHADARDGIDELASRVVGTLLHGIGQEGTAFAPGGGATLGPHP